MKQNKFKAKKKLYFWTSACARRFWTEFLLPKSTDDDLILSVISDGGDLTMRVNSDAGDRILFEASPFSSLMASE